MRQGSLIPQKGERALIVGQTGSGKTAFACWMLMRVETAPCIIYDTKDENKFPKLPNSIIVTTQIECGKQVHNPEIDYIIFRPPDEDLSNWAALDDLLYYHYQNYRHTVCYIDELYTFHNSGRAGKGLTALLSRGRSRGITTIMSTQKPIWISSFALSEAQKYYIFKLGYKADRKRIGELVPDFAELPLPPKHGYYFFESGDEAPRLMAPIKLAPMLDTGYVDETASHPSDSPDGEKANASIHVWV